MEHRLMENPLVSVIIPAFNAEKYIAKAIESVLEQTYTNFEIVVVDNGSTDRTVLIAMRYGRVRVMHQQKRGAAAARNLGIAETHGEFIAFLDADDWWHKEKLQRQVDVLTANPHIGMVFSDHINLTEDGQVIFQTNKKIEFGADAVKSIFRHCDVATSTVMVRRSVINRVGMFDEELACAEDENLWLRIALYDSVTLLSMPLTYYRVLPTSLSRQKEVLNAAVARHLDMLPDRYPDLAKHLGNLVTLRRARLHFSAGLHALSQNQIPRAKQEFITAFRIKPGFRFGLYWFSCLLPRPAFLFVRFLRRLLFA